MKIDELTQVHFRDKWLGCTEQLSLKVYKKDSSLVRWFKHLLQILTFCIGVPDFHAHIRVKRVAQGLFAHFKIDYVQDPMCKQHYYQVIENMLTQTVPSIRKSNRQILESLANKILNYSQ